MSSNYTYQLKYPVRALTTVTSEKNFSQWVAGTNALREENEVTFLQYDADLDKLISIGAYIHAPEVWDIASCPTSASKLATVWSKNGTTGATLWAIPGSPDDVAPPAGDESSAAEGGTEGNQGGDAARTAAGSVRATAQSGHGPAALKALAEFKNFGGSVVRSVCWSAAPDASSLFTVDEGSVRLWSNAEGTLKMVSSGVLGDVTSLWCGAAHPSEASLIATVGSNNAQLWDTRALPGPVLQLPGAGRLPLRSVSWAPGVAAGMRIATAGDDGKVRVWDLRTASSAAASSGGGATNAVRPENLVELGGHELGIWRVAFSPFHPQLLASASSDHTARLFHVPKLAAPSASASASAGAASTSGGAGETRASGYRAGLSDLDTRSERLDADAEESLYCVSWAAADPWTLAAAGYEGRVTVLKVPKGVKSKVLLV